MLVVPAWWTAMPGQADIRAVFDPSPRLLGVCSLQRWLGGGLSGARGAQAPTIIEGTTPASPTFSTLQSRNMIVFRSVKGWACLMGICGGDLKFETMG